MPLLAPALTKSNEDKPFRLQDSSASPSRPVSRPAPVVAPGPTAVAPTAIPPPVQPVVPLSAAAATAPPDDTDAETRYALGMAYKDMGLLEEAKEEFLLSMKDSGFFVDSSLMMGLCVKEQGQSDQAIQLLEKLIADSRCRGGNAQLVRYELGLLYEKMGSWDRAISMYQSIPSFHDVPRRLESLHNHATNDDGALHLSSSKPPIPVPLAGH
jgi:tetratricopeptide (TPR) repeat protein